MTDKKKSTNPTAGITDQGSNVPRDADTKPNLPKKSVKVDDGTEKRGSNVPRNSDTRPKGSGGARTPR